MTSLNKSVYDALINTSLNDVFQAAKQAQMPVFVIHDQQDKDVPVYCASHIYENLPNGKLLITDGLGHRKILGDTQVIRQITAFAISE